MEDNRLSLSTATNESCETNKGLSVSLTKTKCAKNILSLTQEEISALSDESILAYMKNCASSTQRVHKLLWGLSEEKRAITREFMSRRATNSGNSNAVTSSWRPEELEFLTDRLRSYNDFVKKYVEVAEEDNTMTVTVMEDALDEYSNMNKCEEALKDIEDSLNEHDTPISDKVRSDFTVQADSGYKLLERLGKLTPDFRQRVSASSKVSSEFVFEHMRNERDDLRETCYLLKKCVSNQTKTIAELSAQVLSLNQKLFEMEKGINCAKESFTDPIETRGLCTSFLSDMEPLKNACDRYLDAFRRSVRLLESLLESAKSPIIPRSNKSHTISMSSDEGDSESLEQRLTLALQLTSNSKLLVSQLPDELIRGGVRSEALKLVNKTLGAVTESLSSVERCIQHALAQVCCDESTV